MGGKTETISRIFDGIMFVFCRPFIVNNKTRMILQIYRNESEYLAIRILWQAEWIPRQVWMGEEYLDPRTLQPVASRYTEYTTSTLPQKSRQEI